MKPVLPEEIFELILSYAPDFHDNLKSCHKELKYKLKTKYSWNKNTSLEVTDKKILRLRKFKSTPRRLIRSENMSKNYNTKDGMLLAGI